MDGGLGYLIWSICYLVVLFAMAAYGLHRFWMVYLFLRNRHRVPAPAGRFEVLPTVTVQLPVFNELYVTERLLESVSRLDYPRDRLQIQVLDDSTDETREVAETKVRELQAAGFDAVYLHRTNREGYKAGALEEGLATATGEYILILDADFVPEPELLQQTIHYFTDPKMGMIQTRWGHLNSGHSLLTQVQALFLDGHFVIEQTARSHSGRFFNFNGTAGMWRKTCIIDAGGWQHDTLTEDLDLSYRAQLRGWHFVFLPEVVTPGELPVDMNGFKSQQHRWAKGSVQTCKKLLPRIWRSPLPLAVKGEATMHLTANFAYLLLALFCFLLHPASGGPAGGPYRTYFVDIPIFLATNVSVLVFHATAQMVLYPHAWRRKLLLVPVLLALAIGLSVNNARAVLEAIFNKPSEFTRTPKYAIGSQSKGRRPSRLRYAPLKSILPLIEVGFALYFSFFVWNAIVSRQYITLPFLLLFQMGFLYVAASSVLSWLPGWRPWRTAEASA